MAMTLDSIDQKIPHLPYFYSLNPLLLKPKSPSELAKDLEKTVVSSDSFDTFKDCLINLFFSQYDNFPNNIFWDLDYLASHLAHLENKQEMLYFTKRICQLNSTFGRKGKLNFSYSHDFIYGFDWHRWIQKDYEKRKRTKPFGNSFLNYLEKRAKELCNLIEQNDHKYPKLKISEKRNPFSFKRDPESEIRIHLNLQETNTIPLPAWKKTIRTDLIERKHYNFLREEISHKMGLKKEGYKSSSLIIDFSTS